MVNLLSEEESNFSTKYFSTRNAELSPARFLPDRTVVPIRYVRQTESLERNKLGTRNLDLGARTLRDAAFIRSAHPACNHPGDKMTNRLGVLFLLAGAAAASPVFAGDSATMKCNATQDRIWVYDSLNSFDVSAKLKCGETVEITSRVKGYVKIRAANGTEGYVQDSTFPDLPPFVDPNDSQAGVSIAKRVAPRAVAHPAAAALVSASNVPSPQPT